MITNRKETSQRHVEAAIALLHEGKIDCAITLAAAAENVPPPTEDPHLFQQMYPIAKAEDLDLNVVINWLKHYRAQPEEVEIDRWEGAFTICRAITKFIAVYHQSCQPFEDFLVWQRAAGFRFGGSRPLANQA